MSDTIQWTELVNNIINVILVPLLPVLSAYLIALIKKKTNEIETGIKNSELRKYMDIAENAIVTAVTTVNQVYVDAVKKSNGTLPPYEQRVAFEMAREKALSILGESTINAIKNVINDFEVWLEGKIEYYVYQSKNHPDQLRSVSFHSKN